MIPNEWEGVPLEGRSIPGGDPDFRQFFNLEDYVEHGGAFGIPPIPVGYDLDMMSRFIELHWIQHGQRALDYEEIYGLEPWPFRPEPGRPGQVEPVEEVDDDLFDDYSSGDEYQGFGGEYEFLNQPEEDVPPPRQPFQNATPMMTYPEHPGLTFHSFYGYPPRIYDTFEGLYPMLPLEERGWEDF